jgi:hypothetical protein
MTTVELYWPEGVEIYSQYAIHCETYQTLPLLISVSEIERPLNFDFSLENSTVTILLNNYSLYFKEKNPDQIIGKKVIIKEGNITIFLGYICEFPEIGNNILTLKADIFSRLDVPINKEITRDKFPNMPQENEGYSNILYGIANIVPGMMKAIPVSQNKYLASLTTLSEIIDVVNEAGESIFNQCTFENDGDGYTYINYTGTDNIIRFSAKGPIANGRLIENPAMMFSQIYSTFGSGVGFELADVTPAKLLFDERQYDGNILFIDDNTTWRELIDRFSKNFNCRIFITRGGKLKIKVLRWGMETPVLKIHPGIIKEFAFSRDISQIKKKWQRDFQFIPAEGNYKMTPVDIPGTVLDINQVGEFQQIYLNIDSVSWDVSLREAFIRKNPIIVYKFKIPKTEANKLELADTVLLRHRKNIFPEYRQIQILREIRQSGSGFVELEGYDLSEINRRTFILQDEGHPEAAVLNEENNSPTLW